MNQIVIGFYIKAWVIMNHHEKGIGQLQLIRKIDSGKAKHFIRPRFFNEVREAWDQRLIPDTTTKLYGVSSQDDLNRIYPFETLIVKEEQLPKGTPIHEMF